LHDEYMPALPCRTLDRLRLTGPNRLRHRDRERKRKPVKGCDAGIMALDLDASRPLRGIDSRRDLVHAIVRCHPSDESEWLEWKTDPDLKTKAGCFHLAKAILGMANRPVEVAARACGGYGYVVLGVEPENLAGVEMPDPAEWIERVEVYLKGQVGPSWEWMIVPVDGNDVLVVTVDPPQDGDSPWPLRKELDTYRSGTLFVRKPGKTEPALAEDVDALGRRLLAGGSQLPQLLVEVVGDLPIPWLAGAEARENVAGWVQSERERHLEAAKAVEDQRNRPARTLEAADRLDTFGPGGGFLAEQLKWQKAVEETQNLFRANALAQFQDTPDRRTLEEYTAELDAWADELGEPALNDLLRRYCDAGHGLVHLRVANNSTQYLPGVEVRLHISFELAEGFDDVPDGDRLPNAPWAYGKAKPNPLSRRSLLAGMSGSIVPNFGDYGRDHLRDTTIEDGSIRVVLAAGDLRPTAEYDGDDFYIFLPIRPADGLLHATWTATVQNRDGIIDGHLTIPVREEPIDVSEVLSN